MNYQLVYGKNGQFVSVLDIEQNTQVIDQVTTDAAVTEVFLNIPINETTKTNERETKNTYTKKFRPFSTELYNEILQNNLPTTSSNQTGLQENLHRFKLPISNQYLSENNLKHNEDGIKITQVTAIEIKDREINKTESINDKYLLTDKEENIKEIARKIIIENLEKSIPIKKPTKYDFNLENDIKVMKLKNISQQQENQLNEKQDKGDVKPVIDSINLYETIDIKSDKETKDDERKLFLLQEIEESIERGSVKKRSTIFENRTKLKQIIKGRQIQNERKKAFLIGSEMMEGIKRTVELKLSKHLLKLFFLYLTNIMIKFIRYIPHLQLERFEKEEQSTNIIKNNKDNIIKRKLSSADIVQLVSRKPKDLTQKMDTVISEFHSKLKINEHNKLNDKRAKSVSRIEVTKSNNWLSEMNREEMEQVKEELKVATLAAAKRVLGRRRSYHNLTDVENEKVDGLTYIAIVESHVYTNKNAIFEDYISRLKTQVNNVFEDTNANKMFSTEYMAVKSNNILSNREDKDVYMNSEDFKSKELFINKGQRIDYVATVTVEHKYIPTAISIEKDEKTIEINKQALNQTIRESEVKQNTAEQENKIAVKENENLKKIEIPTELIEEMESTTNKIIYKATASLINKLYNKTQEESVEITELNDMPIVNVESTELNKAQAKGKEAIEEISTVLDETEGHSYSYVTSNESALIVEENNSIVQEIVPIIEEVSETNVQQVSVTPKEVTADYAEADTLKITELKEELPTITIEEKLANAHVLNKEIITQLNEVYNEVNNKEVSFDAFEERGNLSTETEKLLATKIVNEAFIHEEPITLPQIEIQTETAKSRTEESFLDVAFTTSHGILNELTTGTDKAVLTEDIEIEKDIAITKTEIKEFESAQIVVIATARQTSEVFDEVQNVEITEITEELPSIKIEEEDTKPVIYGKDVLRQISTVFNTVDELKNENLEDDKAIEVIEIKELSISHKLNYANIEEIHTVFDPLDIQYFNIEKNDEFGTSSTEIQELIKVKSICNATAINIYTKIEEIENFEIETIELDKCTSLEVMEELVNLYCICYAIMEDISTNMEEIDELSIGILDQEVATSNLEEQFQIVKPYCTSIISDIFTNIYEVNDFDTPSIIEEKAIENIEVDVFNKAYISNIEICQEINIPFEEVQIIDIDMPTNEIASMIEEDKIFVTVIPIATSYLIQEDMKLNEVNNFENEIYIEEQAYYEEEKRYYYLPQTICTPIYYYIEIQSEESNTLEICNTLEELATVLIEEDIFINALSICTSISNEINTIYVNAEIIDLEDIQAENIDISEEENNFSKAVMICNEIIQNIKLILEESNEFIIDNFNEEFAETEIVTQVFITAFAFCTSVLSETNFIYFEVELLSDERILEEKAELSEEENKYFNVLVICNEIIEDIKLILKETNELIISKFEEELAFSNLEPQIFSTGQVNCTSISNDITTICFETGLLPEDKLQEETVISLIEENHYFTALKSCIDVCQYIELLLEDSNELEIDQFREEFSKMSTEPFVLERTLAFSTSIICQINEKMYETKYLTVKDIEKIEANVLIEVSKLTLILAICVAAIEGIYEDLEETTSFNVDEIKEETVTINKEPTCISILDKVNNTSISYEVKEDCGNSSYKDTELKATRALTSKQIDYKYDIAENYEANLEKEQVQSTIETRDLTLAHTLNNATITKKVVNPQIIKDNEIHNLVEESAVIKLDTKCKNVIREANISYDSNQTIVKKKNKKAVSTVKDKIDRNINKASLVEISTDLKSLHIKELKAGDIHEQETIIKEPRSKTKETRSERIKTNIKQKSSNAKYEETSIQSIDDVYSSIENDTDVKSVIVKSEPILENVNESTSINILKSKESNEANVNITINKTKSKKDENYQEMSYNLTLIKPQVPDKSDSEIKETLHIKRKENLKHHTEEFQDEFNLNLNQDIESGVVIQEVIDSDENSIDINENQSMDISLKAQKQTKDVNKTLVKRSKEHDSNEESADLTIFRKEAESEGYDDNLTRKHMIGTCSNNSSEFIGLTKNISQSDFELKSTNDNKKLISKGINKSNAQSLKGLKKETNEEISSYEFKDVDINASKSQISTIEGSFERSVETSSSSKDSKTLVTQEFDSTVLNKTKKLSLKTDLKRVEIEGIITINTNESSPEIESPTIPPTPLIDEYIFRLVAPLPKSRSTTPIPREPTPEIQKDQSIVTKNLVPNIESVAIETVVYSPSLPTPTSPVHSPTYTKPGLNGGMKRLPRYFKPGLRGGSDRPPIPKEEILEVKKNLTTLSSDINETLKNIEKYKKKVEILKQQKEEGTSKMIEDTDEQTKPKEDRKDGKEMESLDKTTEKSNNEQPSKTDPTIQPNPQIDYIENELNNEKPINIDIQDFTNRIEEARIKSYNIKEVTTFEEIEKECNDTGIVDLPDTAGEESIEKEFILITEDSALEKPESNVLKIETDEEIEKSVDIVDVTVEEERKTADDEVARVLELTTNTSKEISPVQSPNEGDTTKEDHVISLTRVLSSHMIREGLSPDCQRMIDKFENKQNVLEEKNDRTWTTFLQKTNLEIEKLDYFTDLQNKFNKQEPFATKLIDRNEQKISPVFKPKDFNSSPVPWQERALADTLGASNMKEMTPGDEPKFFLAIPMDSKEEGLLKSTVIPLTNNQISNIEKNKLQENKTERTVDEIIQETLKRVENLNIGEGKNRLIKIFLNNIKNITNSSIPVEEQLNKMKDQLETLEQIPDIIKEILENVAEKLHLLNKNNEGIVNTKGDKYQKEDLAPKVNITAEVSKIEQPQIIKEEAKVEKMPAETKGELLVKDKKQFASQIQQQPNRPQQKFGRMNPEPRPMNLFRGRRWRRPGEEYTEEQIAETILAHSELIQGKTMGINFLKYEKPPIPLDHLQHSEVFKMIHNTEITHQKPVELLSTVISEADYRERCQPLSICPSESSNEFKSTF